MPTLAEFTYVFLKFNLYIFFQLLLKQENKIKFKSSKLIFLNLNLLHFEFEAM